MKRLEIQRHNNWEFESSNDPKEMSIMADYSVELSTELDEKCDFVEAVRPMPAARRGMATRWMLLMKKDDWILHTMVRQSIWISMYIYNLIIYTHLSKIVVYLYIYMHMWVWVHSATGWMGVTEAVSSPIQEAEEEAETVAAAPAVSGAPGGVPKPPGSRPPS